MPISRVKRVAIALTIGFVTAILAAVAGATPASAHGFTDAPISRALFCERGTVKQCGQVQWEPQSVEGPKGFPTRGPADGRLCAGGIGRFSELDDPRGGNWPTNKVNSGQSYTFSWDIEANHATTDFKYYLTKPGWDPTQPLTRADLDLTPVLTVPFGGAQPPHKLTHNGTLPSRTGHHLLLAVWTIADTGNAFYQCSDLDFS